MSRHFLDYGHSTDSEAQTRRFAAIERMKTADAQHPAIKMLNRRRKGPADPARVKHYMRIIRGYRA